MSATSPSTPQRLSLDDLEHHVVAAALADTDILEVVHARIASRLRGRLSSLFNAAQAYFGVTHSALPRDALQQMLQRSEPDPTKHDDYLGLYDMLTNPPYSELDQATRRWHIHSFDEEWQIAQTGSVLAEAAEALRSGHQSHGKDLVGAPAAWALLMDRRVDFDRYVTGTGNQEAELTTTVDRAKHDYHKATQSDYLGAPLALPEVNARLYGLQPGDMHIITAFAHEGKSFMMLNDAHTAWKSGQNVALATGEMSVPKYRARFIALHSCEPQFPLKLATTKIERGQLSKEEHECFLQVLEDLRTNQAYGKFFLFAFPFGATPSLVFNKFAGYDKVAPIGFGIVDYLGLMSSDRMRVSRREELDDLIRQTKALALDFGGGRGLPTEVGYQTNRQSYEQARRDGYYTLSCFAESSEAEKSADSAVWLLSLPQNTDELKMGFVKNRGDELGEHFVVRRNFKHAQLTSLKSSRGRSSSASSLLDV